MLKLVSGIHDEWMDRWMQVCIPAIIFVIYRCEHQKKKNGKSSPFKKKKNACKICMYSCRPKNTFMRVITFKICLDIKILYTVFCDGHHN